MLSGDVKKTYLRKTLAADELAAHLTLGASTEQSELCLHTEETNLTRTQINMQQKWRHKEINYSFLRCNCQGLVKVVAIKIDQD